MRILNSNRVTELNLLLNYCGLISFIVVKLMDKYGVVIINLEESGECE